MKCDFKGTRKARPYCPRYNGYVRVSNRRGKTRRLSLLELALLFAQSASFLTLALLVSLGRDLGVALLHFGEAPAAGTWRWQGGSAELGCVICRSPGDLTPRRRAGGGR